MMVLIGQMSSIYKYLHLSLIHDEDGLTKETGDASSVQLRNECLFSGFMGNES